QTPCPLRSAHDAPAEPTPPAHFPAPDPAAKATPPQTAPAAPPAAAPEAARSSRRQDDAAPRPSVHRSAAPPAATEQLNFQFALCNFQFAIAPHTKPAPTPPPASAPPRRPPSNQTAPAPP